MSILQTAAKLVSRLHDLWIVLAWAGIVAAVMLNTFYTRNCNEFQMSRNVTATCQSALDVGLMSLAAVGAGMTFTDERVGYIGFIPAHIIATIVFVTVLVIPSLLGLTDPLFLNVMITNASLLAFKSQVPFQVFFSFFGSILGIYLGGKIRG
jgi:hypothetical protein